jgi:hypothetical protein
MILNDWDYSGFQIGQPQISVGAKHSGRYFWLKAEIYCRNASPLPKHLWSIQQKNAVKKTEKGL